MYFSHFASYLALTIFFYLYCSLFGLYVMWVFSTLLVHVLAKWQYLKLKLRTTHHKHKMKNCIIWYYLCINVAIDEVIYGTSSTPEKQRSTAKQQHHLKIRQMSWNCRQANRPEPNQLHMKRMHIYPIHWIESNQAFSFFFFFFVTYHIQGQARSQVPMGLSRRARRA